MYNYEYDEDFKYYLSEETDVELDIIETLLESEANIFNVALKLADDHGVDADELGRIWGDYLGLAYVNPNKSIINDEYIKLLGEDFILTNSAIPLYKLGKAVTIATSKPHNTFFQDQIEKKLNEMVSFVFCFPFDIEICLNFLKFKKQSD